MLSKNLLLNAAYRYSKNGCSVIPTARSKKPECRNWKPYQTSPASTKQIRKWFTAAPHGIAIVCGRVSGGIVCLDFDTKNDHEGNVFDRWCDTIEKIRPGFVEELVVEETPSSGYHCIFRTKQGERNRKLATNEDGEVLIETRGEGGYFVCAPTPGYHVISGDFLNIPTITPEEFGLLISSAIALTERDIESKDSAIADAEAIPGSPFDDYDKQGDILLELERHGWKYLFREGCATYLQRPGKKGQGISASYNHIPNRFYVFSTSTVFEANKVYKPYAVYTYLNHNGDFKKAKQTLLDAGYGSESPGKFWHIGKNGLISIDNNKLIRFLVSAGFRKTYIHENRTSIFVRITDNMIEEVSTEQIKDFVISFTKSLPWVLVTTEDGKDIYQGDLLCCLIKGANVYFGRDKLEFIDQLEGRMHEDGKDASYFYFENCFVKVSANGMELMGYDKLDGYVWKHRKQNREFSITEIKSRKSEYERFIENLCAKDSKRIHALRTAIGYILHRHREESKAKAVILVDEKLTDSLEPEGRTGKSIFGKSLNHLRIVEILDGKTFDSKNRFNYQNVAIDCDIIMVDDAREKFPFETLFHDITAGIEIERKNMPAIRIPFEESPRFLITTNHGILGNSGSYRDRMVEYEFAPYYSDTFSPRDEFNHELFAEWDAGEWLRFDNYMLECVQIYLRDGLSKYSLKTLPRRKLIQSTSPEFVEFMDDAIKTGRISLNQLYVKNDILDDFKREYKDPETAKISSNTFTAWTLHYAVSRGWKYENVSKKINRKTVRCFMMTCRRKMVTKLHSKSQ